MPIPIICMDQHLRQYPLSFRASFSGPQMQYFVMVLLALMLCQENRTLTGLQRQVAEQTSLSGLSRFLAEAPWSAERVVDQVMSATAIVRFWTLVMAAYLFLDEERERLAVAWQRHVTVGEVRREVQRVHRHHLIDWLFDQFEAGASREILYRRLAA